MVVPERLVEVPEIGGLSETEVGAATLGSGLRFRPQPIKGNRIINPTSESNMIRLLLVLNNFIRYTIRWLTDGAQRPGGAGGLSRLLARLADFGAPVSRAVARSAAAGVR